MFEEDETGFGIRRTSEDKLTYKNIIADAINWCRKSMGTRHMPNAVQGLERIIKFDVKGYKLKTKLIEIQADLKAEKIERKKREKRRMGRNFYGNSEQARFKLRQSEWYWNKYFEEIIQLLADNKLLVETEKTIPVKEIGRRTDEKEE